eukprot:scaffold201606_cov36-Tisochrysis_lutea.AAC.2
MRYNQRLSAQSSKPAARESQAGRSSTHESPRPIDRVEEPEGALATLISSAAKRIEHVGRPPRVRLIVWRRVVLVDQIRHSLQQPRVVVERLGVLLRHKAK